MISLLALVGEGEIRHLGTGQEGKNGRGA